MNRPRFSDTGYIDFLVAPPRPRTGATLDPSYSRAMRLVHRRRSGTLRAVVDGLDPITLLWSEGSA
jgi:hypothetical protein